MRPVGSSARRPSPPDHQATHLRERAAPDQDGTREVKWVEASTWYRSSRRNSRASLHVQTDFEKVDLRLILSIPTPAVLSTESYAIHQTQFTDVAPTRAQIAHGYTPAPRTKAARPLAINLDYRAVNNYCAGWAYAGACCCTAAAACAAAGGGVSSRVGEERGTKDVPLPKYGWWRAVVQSIRRAGSNWRSLSRRSSAARVGASQWRAPALARLSEGDVPTGCARG